MKEISLVVAKIFDVFIGIPKDSVNIVLPLTYESKRATYTFTEIKNLKRVWGYGVSFKHEGKDIKILDLSAFYRSSGDFHKFKYVIVCNKIAIRVDDIIDIENYFFRDIYLFPLYLQRVLNLEYIWGIVINAGDPIYLIDPKILKCD